MKEPLEEHIPGTVLLASWLEKKGISYDLQKYYRKSGWLESVGTGAFKRPKDQVQWQGGLFAIQTQANLPVHVGGPSALSLQGLAHYVRLGEETLHLFSPQIKLPVWFLQYNWNVKIEHIKTSMLPSEIGLVKNEEKNFSIQISSPERAILECLYLAPDQFDLIECYQLFEGLTNLRPGELQQLLELCKSVKVKRLFLYMAHKANHQWLSFIDLSKISLGHGDRSVVKGGIYVSQFNISIPKELAGL
ncbi:MAG: hypothetical protein HC905_05915 [Bacteroidales bacterium]|nr:hypothetical protein [Bacteroidales bacterium]